MASGTSMEVCGVWCWPMHRIRYHFKFHEPWILRPERKKSENKDAVESIIQCKLNNRFMTEILYTSDKNWSEYHCIDYH